MIESPLENRLHGIVAGIAPEVERRLLPALVRSAAPPRLLSKEKGANVGVVNVIDPKLYAKSDVQALASFAKVEPDGNAMSMETTHGVICTVFDAPFFTVSGIANGVGKFETEVAPRKYAQNLVAAHNAGIAVAWLLSKFCVI